MKKTFGTKVFAVLAALAVLLTFALPKAACAQSVYPDTGDFELRCVYENMPLVDLEMQEFQKTVLQSEYEILRLSCCRYAVSRQVFAVARV